MMTWLLKSQNTLLIWFRSGIKGVTSMIWTDINEIAIELCDTHPNIDPQYVNFVDLRGWILELDGFEDDPERCGEKILEAIQMAWIEEKD